MKRIFNLQNLSKVFLYSFAIISLVFTRPLVVNADTWTEAFRGATLSYEKNVYTWTFNYHVLGYIEPQITFKYTPNGSVNQIQPHINVNGTQVSYEISNSVLYDVSYNIQTYSLRKVSDMDISGIIQYLLEIYDNQEDIIDQLEIIYGNTNELIKMRQWHFPFESFNFISTCLNLNPTYEVGIVKDNYYDYPIFKFDGTNTVYYGFTNAGQSFKSIFIVNQNLFNSTNFLTKFNISNVTIENYNVNVYSRSFFDDTLSYIIEVTFKGVNQGRFYIYNTSPVSFIPIYFGDFNNKNISTDFALLWGLSNQLLDDLHIIAQGTQQSSSSSSFLDSNTSQLNTDSQQMFTFENTQNTNMNNALQNINTNLDIGTFGSKFLTSASWVKTQFDNITNTSPFGSVLSFSLILGLAMLIIGKVRK